MFGGFEIDRDLLDKGREGKRSFGAQREEEEGDFEEVLGQGQLGFVLGGQKGLVCSYGQRFF